MERVRWIGFCFVNPMSRAVVHFYPSGTGMTAPYSANCLLSIFGNGIERSQVVLEGARLSQPDGVRLDDAFPTILTGFAGVLGIEVEIATGQARVDLSGSQCLIELVSKNDVVRFRAKRVVEKDGRSISNALALRNRYQNTSVIVVNGSTAPGRAGIKRVDGFIAASEQLSQGLASQGSAEPSLGMIPAHSVVEVPINESWYSNIRSHEIGSGKVQAVPLATLQESPEMVYYTVYRDPSSNRPVSIAAV